MRTLHPRIASATLGALVATLSVLVVAIPSGAAARPSADRMIHPDEAASTGTGTTNPAATVGGKIAFRSNRAGASTNVWLMKPDGSGAKQITIAGGSGPDLSPDGTKIAFVGLTGTQQDIYT